MQNSEKIQEIESQILSLCEERNSLLYEEGIDEPYLVYCSDLHKLDNNVWVLRPYPDYHLMEDVALTLVPSERKEFLKWIEEYKSNSCSDICPIVGTPRCCKVCSLHEQCEYELVRCNSETEECERRGSYSEEV